MHETIKKKPMISKHCISSHKTKLNTNIMNMVISLSMSFSKYLTINSSCVHLLQGLNSLHMKENDKSGLCYVVNDVILLKLGTSHIHGIEQIRNVDSCKSFFM